MSEQQTICRLAPEVWRKAYFGASINDQIDAVSSQGAITEAELAELDTFLKSLEEEREKIKCGVAKYTKTDTVKLPSPDELMGIDGDKEEAIKKWEAEREEDYKKCKQIFATANAAKGHKVTRDQWLDWGLELANYQYNLDVYRVWKDQKYRARLVNIMDTFGCSRASAEERAKMTPEYRDYKNAVLFRGLVEEVIMLCKKYYV